MQDDDEIVVGEGVVLDSAAATAGLRILSGLIDYILLGFVWVLALIFVMLPILESLLLDQAAFLALLLGMNLTFVVVIPTTVETLSRGRSLGRLATGTRIVRDDGGPITVRHAFTRALIGIFEIWASFGTVAALASMLSPRSKRIGDAVAGTYAVRTRAGGKAHAPVVMPAQLEEWARTVDIRRLPDGLALNARQFIARAASLSPAARQRIGTDFAKRLTPFVAPLPPAGTHPETFIAAVLATRRDREYAIALEVQRADQAQAAGVKRLPFGVADVAN